MSLENTSVKCPKCEETFKVDDSVYTDIVKQVRDQQFNDELNQRLLQAQKEKEDAIALTKAETANASKDTVASLEKQLLELQSSSKQQLAEELAKKEVELAEKNAQIQAKDSKLQLAIAEAVSQIEKERDTLKNTLELQKSEQQLALNNALKKIEKERDDLKNELKSKATEQQLLEKSLETSFQEKLAHKDETLKLKDGEIERLKDFKQKQSTKMLGESLEQHCEIEFNKLRATAFQNAYFEKDNDASGGTKGDFIFKEEDGNGNEIISIMFEMKNENDQTATKKKNEDFFAKLDKDRNDKNCEYAVLVSALETDNEFYNTGIVDVSYKYPKMFVIRPQFFIPMITLLRNAGMKSLQYKDELNTIRNQNLDVTNFEEKINTIRDGFGKNYLSASTHFEQAIKEIDNSIAKMQKVKKELVTTGNQLRLANQKLEGLTIKKLTYNNPTMKEKLKNTSNS